jgi:hypothetical protein
MQNHSQGARVPVAAAVNVIHTETVAAAPPQKSKLFFLEILKGLRKARNDRGIPSGLGRRNSARPVNVCGESGGKSFRWVACLSEPF